VWAAIWDLNERLHRISLRETFYVAYLKSFAYFTHLETGVEKITASF
jgi:hypothetical protein